MIVSDSKYLLIYTYSMYKQNWPPLQYVGEVNFAYTYCTHKMAPWIELIDVY